MYADNAGAMSSSYAIYAHDKGISGPSQVSVFAFVCFASSTISCMLTPHLDGWMWSFNLYLLHVLLLLPLVVDFGTRSIPIRVLWLTVFFASLVGYAVTIWNLQDPFNLVFAIIGNYPQMSITTDLVYASIVFGMANKEWMVGVIFPGLSVVLPLSRYMSNQGMIELI